MSRAWIAVEPWLPALCGVTWWLVFYPGFFGEDSLINLTEAPTIVIALSLEMGLLATAPISEGRYGLFILVCGQSAGLFFLMEWIGVRRDASPSPIE